jgi:hypothetical protein
MSMVMNRYASLSAVIAAVLLLPGAATAADVGASSAADMMTAYFGDQELSFAAPVNASVAAAAASATQAPAYDLSASLAVQDPMAAPDQFAALSEEELGGQRGGFMTPLGLEVGFGAIVRTTIDGALALEQTLTITDQGVVREVTGGALTPDLVAAAAAGGINLDPAANLAGVVSPGANGGATAVLTDVGTSFLNSVVINTANNRDINQNTQINLNIPAFAAAQQGFIGQQMQLRFDQELGAALAASLPR